MLITSPPGTNHSSFQSIFTIKLMIAVFTNCKIVSLIATDALYDVSVLCFSNDEKYLTHLPRIKLIRTIPTAGQIPFIRSFHSSPVLRLVNRLESSLTCLWYIVQPYTMPNEAPKARSV